MHTAFQGQEERSLRQSERLPHNRVALARALLGKQDIPEVVSTQPLNVQQGDVETFWVNNVVNHQNYTVTAKLRYVGPAVLMYVEEGFKVDQEALERAAVTFEQQVYPHTRAIFGSEWYPGIDGDPRITILNTQSRGDSAVGYFSPRDSTPRAVNRFSNEREMFYMKIPPSNGSYISVLTHEYQHMIHWHEQRRSETWFNESCSTLAQDINGYGTNSFVGSFLSNPDTQLTMWTTSAGASILAHYGAANLFMRYFYSHYANDEGAIASLVRADASNNLQAFVGVAEQTRPDISSFGELFGDWAVANLVGDPLIDDGRYGYPAGNNSFSNGLAMLPNTVTPTELPTQTTYEDDVHQFGTDYLKLPPGPATITFTGTTAVSLVGAQPHGTHAWWSGRGDNSYATLTRNVALTGLQMPTLFFDLWYEMEPDYDYGFVSVSTDGGETWQTVAGEHTTNEDPQGANYGNGITGISGTTDREIEGNTRGTWVKEVMDLSPYVGNGQDNGQDAQEVQIRFWQINDEGFNAPGMLIDNIRICERNDETTCVLEDDVEHVGEPWQAEGFVRVDGTLPQEWQLHMVFLGRDGKPYYVSPLSLDGEGTTTLTLDAGAEAVLVVSGVTPYTAEQARYRITASPLQ